jgi:hypothetical protein
MRASGRSFRCVLRALVSASNGYNVVYVCDRNYEHFMHMVADICLTTLSPDSFKIIKNQREIRFNHPGPATLRQGRIKFYDLRSHSEQLIQESLRGADWERIDDINGWY